MSGALLLTGATGFLGRHVLARLAAERPEQDVLVLVRSLADWQKLDYARELPRVTPLEGDLVGDETWLTDPRLADLAGVIHLAALVRHSRREPGPLMSANVDGTLRLVRLAARERAPMVFVSSSGTVACHRKPGVRVDEEAPYLQRVVGGWPYYASKIEAERKARALACELGVPLMILRPPVLLGPGDHRFRSTSNVIRYMRGKLPFLIDGGISFCDVRDVAAATIAALDHPARRPVYHLPGHDLSIAEFFGLCREVCGVEPPKRFLPYWAAHALADAAERLAHRGGVHSPLPDPVVIEMARHHWGIASRHAEGELAYRVRDARETLADTIAWLREHHPQLQSG